MDEDNTSTDAVQETSEQPAEDPILQALSETEDSDGSTESEEVEETQDEEDTEAEAEPEAEQGETDDEETQDADPKEEARRRYEERQKAIAEREVRIKEQTEEYVAQGEDEYDQRLRAMEVQQYSALVERNEGTLINEFERAKANPNLQVFNPENKESFNEKAYNKAIKDFNAGYVQYDQNGNMVGLEGSLFEYLTETAELLSDASQSGAVQQVRATRNIRNNADTKPAAPPKETQKDPILDILKSD